MEKDTLKMVAAGAGALILLIGVGAAGYLSASKASKRAAEFEEQLTAAQQELAAFGKFDEPLAKAKAELAAAGKALNVTMVEELERSEPLQKGNGPVRADGKATLQLAIEYEFGFDLAADKIELAAAGKGAQLKLAPPALVAAPVVRVKSFSFPPKAIDGEEGKLADEMAQKLVPEFEARGKVLAENEAIRAVCEKRVLEQVRGTLQKQSGLRLIPDVALIYPKG